MRTGLALLIVFFAVVSGAAAAPRITVATSHGSAEALAGSGCTTTPVGRLNRMTCALAVLGEGPLLPVDQGATLTIRLSEPADLENASLESSDDGTIVQLTDPVPVAPLTYTAALPPRVALPRHLVLFVRYREPREWGDRAWSVRLVPPSGLRGLFTAGAHAPAAASLPFR